MAVSTARKQVIGRALASLVDDVTAHTLDLVRQSRAVNAPPIMVEIYRISLLKQAVDTPSRARAQVQAWMDAHDTSRSPGAAQTFLSECLVAAGSSTTLAQINTTLAALEAQALTVVGHVENDGWTWDQVAAAIEAAIVWERVDDFTFARLPIPTGYTTIWGDRW